MTTDITTDRWGQLVRNDGSSRTAGATPPSSCGAPRTPREESRTCTAAPARPRVRTGEDDRFRLEVGQGDVVDVHAGPPRDHNPSGAIGPADPEREVVIPGVMAGARDLVIHLR